MAGWDKDGLAIEQNRAHKARVFAASLGLTAADAHYLREALLAAARENDAVPAEHDEYGKRANRPGHGSQQLDQPAG